MFLRSTKRFKDGKEHRYWSIVENRRVSRGRTVQKQVLYLGEINDSQKEAWIKTIEMFPDGKKRPQQIALFPSDRQVPALNCDVVQVKLNQLALRKPRQWGACWLALDLWDQLWLDDFWSEKLPPSRKGTNWLNVFKTLVCYRLIDPGSEWRLHREWFNRSAMGDLLGEDFGLAQKDKLYRVLDKLTEHKKELFSFLQSRWKDMFNAKFDVLLYDLTSTYFECDPPSEGKRKFGYSRDKRSDCVQVVIALIVTPEGFPLAYEVMNGNTRDNTTLTDFLEKIEKQYGKSNRVWVMDRGIPTEDTLELMRNSEPPVSYLVGTPKGRLTKLEKSFLSLPWQKVRESVDVKLLNKDDELYILARSKGRVEKEAAMRIRKYEKLWKRLETLQKQKLTRDQLLIKIGAAKKDAGGVFSLVTINLPNKDEAVTPKTFTFTPCTEKIKEREKREGRYLLRSNLSGDDPVLLWKYYIQLTEVEQAFKELKGDLSIRPVYHQKDSRIEAHIFVAFMAYCLQVTLKQRSKALATGLTPRAVLDKFAAIQMVDVHIPTTDGRQITLSRYTEPERDLQFLLAQLKMNLPAQPPPKIEEKEIKTTVVKS